MHEDLYSSYASTGGYVCVVEKKKAGKNAG
jgi:hypothetical protein